MPTDARISKEEAGYLYVGPLGARCGNCIFFVGLKGECLLVRGNIGAFYCCNGWSRNGEKRNDFAFTAGSAFGPALILAEAILARGE